MTARTRKRAMALGSVQALLLTALVLPPALHGSDGNLVSIQQMDSGAQGATINVVQEGARNTLAGPGSLNFAAWLTLNSHPDINSSDLFSRSGDDAVVGTDITLNLIQTGDDNDVALLAQGTGAALPGANQTYRLSMVGNGNKAEIIPTGLDPSNVTVDLSLTGDSNLARLRPENGGTLMLDIEGSGNEFVLKQNAGSVDSLINVQAFGDGHAGRLRQDGSNLTLNLTFLGTGVGPLELLQTGSNFDFTMTYDSSGFNEAFTVTPGP